MIQLQAAFVLIVAFCAGYLVRRWHRPVYMKTSEMAEGEWKVSMHGGHPHYRSISVSGRYAVTPLGLAELVKAIKSDDPTLHLEDR